MRILWDFSLRIREISLRKRLAVSEIIFVLEPISKPRTLSHPEALAEGSRTGVRINGILRSMRLRSE